MARRTLGIALLVAGVALLGVVAAAWVLRDPQCSGGAYGNYCSVGAFGWSIFAGVPGLAAILIGVALVRPPRSPTPP